MNKRKWRVFRKKLNRKPSGRKFGKLRKFPVRVMRDGRFVQDIHSAQKRLNAGGQFWTVVPGRRLHTPKNAVNRFYWELLTKKKNVAGSESTRGCHTNYERDE